MQIKCINCNWDGDKKLLNKKRCPDCGSYNTTPAHLYCLLNKKTNKIIETDNQTVIAKEMNTSRMNIWRWRKLGVQKEWYNYVLSFGY